MSLLCPNCKAPIKEFRNPLPTVDVIIEINNGIVLIERRNEPFGWALPGGFVDYGETLEHAASREAKEETGLDLRNLRQFRAYSDPGRDPRQHNISIVFSAEGVGELLAGDDATGARIFNLNHLPENLCFDHKLILSDYIKQQEIS